MSDKKAWVTLATNDTYSLGALVLAHSLKKVNTKYDVVVLITSSVTYPMRSALQAVVTEVKEVNILDSDDAENLRLLARPELGVTFTKLHCWRLTQYEKCVFLDADTLVLQNCDELFEREELSAAPDVGWPDCFNSGVFVFKPSEETYQAIISFALLHGSFDGGDQGLLNMFFSGWATGDASKRLPFLYNLSSAAVYSYLPAFKWFGKGVKVVHFIGNSKPWSQAFNSVTRTVSPDSSSSHLTNFLQYWWDLFCSNIHNQLSPEMTRLHLRRWYTPHTPIKYSYPSRSNPFRLDPLFSINNNVTISETNPDTSEEHFEFTDPWEEFEKANTINGAGGYEDEFNASNNKDTNFEPISDNDNFERYLDNVVNSVLENIVSSSNYVSCTDGIHCEPSHQHNITDNSNSQNFVSVENNSPHPVESHRCCINPYAIHTNCIPSELLLGENDLLNYSTDETNDNGGLAATLSQLKLEDPTPEQLAEADMQRRQEWEQGRIDFMGRDSFDNIWNKISSTMNKQTEAPAVTEATDVPPVIQPSLPTPDVPATAPIATEPLVLSSQRSTDAIVSDPKPATEQSLPSSPVKLEPSAVPAQPSQPAPSVAPISPELPTACPRIPTEQLPATPPPSESCPIPPPRRSAQSAVPAAQAAEAKPETPVTSSPPVSCPKPPSAEASQTAVPPVAQVPEVKSKTLPVTDPTVSSSPAAPTEPAEKKK